MLPTEPKSQLPVTQEDKPMLKSSRQAVLTNSIRQFASKTGVVIMKHPFWLLVISSLGIHTAFVLLSPSPLKKPEPTEVKISAVPVVKLPSKPLVGDLKTNKSSLDNLFVKPLTSKNGQNLNTFQNPFSNSSSNSFDLDKFDSYDDPSTVTTRVPFEDPSTSEPAVDNSPQKQISTTPKKQTQNPPLVKKQTQIQSDFTPDGKINNITPSKIAGNNLSDPPPKDNIINLNSAKDTSKSDPKEKEIGEKSSPYSDDPQLLTENLQGKLIQTLIVRPGSPVSFASTIEKEVEWIEPIGNVEGLSGTVTYTWLVESNGDVKKTYIASSKNEKLDDIVRKTVKRYKLKPSEGDQKGKRRLVTVKYTFPKK